MIWYMIWYMRWYDMIYVKFKVWSNGANFCCCFPSRDSHQGLTYVVVSHQWWNISAPEGGGIFCVEFQRYPLKFHTKISLICVFETPSGPMSCCFWHTTNKRLAGLQHAETWKKMVGILQIVISVTFSCMKFFVFGIRLFIENSFLGVLLTFGGMSRFILWKAFHIDHSILWDVSDRNFKYCCRQWLVLNDFMLKCFPAFL